MYFFLSNAVRFARTKSCIGNRPNILFCKHQCKLTVYDVLRDHSDFIIVKFYYISVDDNHKHAASFMYELTVLRDKCFRFPNDFDNFLILITRSELRDIIDFVCTA